MDNPSQYRTAISETEDRRKSVRYPITGKTWFQWEAADATCCDAEGMATNIGKAGVFIESESLPPIASVLKLSVVLPTGWATSTALRLSGSGRVRHVRRTASQNVGFGASAVFKVQMSTPARPGDESQ